MRFSTCQSLFRAATWLFVLCAFGCASQPEKRRWESVLYRIEWPNGEEKGEIWIDAHGGAFAALIRGTKNGFGRYRNAILNPSGFVASGETTWVNTRAAGFLPVNDSRIQSVTLSGHTDDGLRVTMNVSRASVDGSIRGPSCSGEIYSE